MILKHRVLLLLVLAIGCSADRALGADAAELSAKRQKQLQELFDGRATLLASVKTLGADLAKLRRELEKLEADYKRVAASRNAIPRDKPEVDKKGKVDTKALRENQENARKRRALEAQMTGIQGQGQAVTQSVQVAEKSYNEALGKLNQVQDEWIGATDRFGRLTRAEHRSAVPLFDQWLQQNGTDVGALIARGLAHQHSAQPADAQADFTRAIDVLTPSKKEPPVEFLRPMLVLAYCARGRLQAAEGQERESAQDFRAALAQGRDNKSPLEYLVYQGVLDCTNQKFAAAQLKFAKATQLYPIEAEGYRLLALVYAASPADGVRSKQKALSAGQKACELSKYNDWACVYALAAAKAEAGDFAEAARLAAQAAELTIDEHRDECLRCRKEYDELRPLRLDWK